MAKYKRPKATRKVAKIGDKIKFEVVTRQGIEKGIRVVKGYFTSSTYMVRFRGYSEFIVKQCEISEVIRNNSTTIKKD